MSECVVCGGSMIGLTTAMMLAREGHHVTVLEGDGAPVPDDPSDAWDRWARSGVAQFHQPHNLFARARQIMDSDLPGLTDRLLEAGGSWINPIANPPPSITDRSPRPDDEKFRFVNARRPVMEAAFAKAANDHEGVSVRRGVRGAGLLDGPPVVDGAPHVVGVQLEDGDRVPADLVIDAMGRRSKLADWLQAIGGRPPRVESEDSGFVYYTRYFRGPEPPAQFGPVLAPIGTLSILTLQSDNGTWSVTLFGASNDVALRRLREPDAFTAVVRACPLQRHWLDGEPITGIEVMAGILDKYRRFVVDEQPIVTGVVSVGDAWACTNPSAGRGISVGTLHAQRLRDVVRNGLDEPDAVARRFDAVTEADVTPFYRNQIASDRTRIAEMNALRVGSEPPPPDPTMVAIGAAMMEDADVFRGVMEVVTCLALPQEVFARPALQAKISEHTNATPTSIPAPSRDELLALVS